VGGGKSRKGWERVREAKRNRRGESGEGRETAGGWREHTREVMAIIVVVVWVITKQCTTCMYT